MKTLTFTALLATSAFLATSAMAEITDGKCAPNFSGNVPNSFATVDTNSDGMISKEEMGEYVAGGQLDTLFGRWDADTNGSLSEEEFCYR